MVELSKLRFDLLSSSFTPLFWLVFSDRIQRQHLFPSKMGKTSPECFLVYMRKRGHLHSSFPISVANHVHVPQEWFRLSVV